jgi:methylthioribose-1-phosphate isomerase
MQQEKIPYCVITDNMAGHFMKTAGIDAVIVGADRIAANGDTANKIGTYSLSILARHHRIPFYVAAPSSTIDFSTRSGDDIPIEQRSVKEVLFINNISIAPKGAVARHPGFDITPAAYITAIITEVGVIKPSALKSNKLRFS